MPATHGRSRSRLASVDALRGITVAAMLLVNDPGDWGHVFGLLDHAQWNGATPTDFVFPMFLFIMGVSIALAIVPRLENGRDKGSLRNAALWRAARIIALGLIINACAAWLLPGRDMRFPGVLQRIGICFAFSGLLAIYTPRKVWRIVVVALLVIYTLLLVSVGTLAKWDNIVDRVDTWAFGHYVWNFNAATGQAHDPEGLLSTMTALVTSLLGLYAGVWLREKRFGHLFVGAIIAAALGWIWHLWIPFNKNLWTPSYTLWTAGWSTLVLLAFYWLVEIRGWPAFGRRFGVNAIAAYGGSEFMQILLPAAGLQTLFYTPLERWITPVAGPYVASLSFAVLFVFVWWLIVSQLDRHRWYLKI